MASKNEMLARKLRELVRENGCIAVKDDYLVHEILDSKDVDLIEEMIDSIKDTIYQQEVKYLAYEDF